MISAMGAKVYKTLQNLINPHNPSDKSVKQLADIMTKHFCLLPSEIVQRCKFNTSARKPDKPVANYITELKHYPIIVAMAVLLS